MKKKIFFICFLLVFIGCFCLFGVGLKANATVYKSDTYVRVYTDNDSCMVLFQLPYIGSDTDFDFLYNEDGNVLLYLDYRYSMNYNGQLSRHFYANGDSAKPMSTDSLYLIRFDNGINHYIFYSIDLVYSADNTFTSDSIVLTELFTISDLTGTVEFFDIIGSGYIMRNDYYSSSTTEQYKNQFLVSYFNSNPFVLDSFSRYSSGYNAGYNSGYNTGYDEGQSGENAISPVWNVLTGIFNSVGAILSIELIPRIPIGLLIFVPLFFIMVMAILSIWRKHW